MQHPLSFLGGCIAGALAMYYLDPSDGARRRALVRDKLASTGRASASQLHTQGKYLADRARGAVASPAARDSDRQLHERVRTQLGRVVSHPRHVQVDVAQGCVRLDGHAVRGEVDRLMATLRGMAGVREVENRLRLHDDAAELDKLPAHAAQQELQAASA